MMMLTTLLVLALANFAFAFEGTYTGEYDGKTMIIEKMDMTTYAVSVRIVAEECLGEIDTSAQLVGSSLSALGSLGGSACHLTIGTADWGVTVLEGDGCIEYHGPDCSFEGSYSQP